MPLAVMVTFDKYCGPTLHDGTVPVTLIPHHLPFKLAWAVWPFINHKDAEKSWRS